MVVRGGWGQHATLGDVEDVARRAVSGAAGESDSVHEPLLDICAASYLRACFYTKGFDHLRNRSSQLDRAARDHDEIDESVVPARALISQAYKREEGCSLEGLLRIRNAIKVIRDTTPTSSSAASFAAWLKIQFPHPDVLPTGSIIPSLQTPNRDLIRQIQGKSEDSAAFSAKLLKGTEIPSKAVNGFIGHILNGYQLPKGREPGTYKLTKRTAQVLHRQLLGLHPDVPPLHEFSPASAEAGPRKGQISKALGVPLGNLLA